MTEAEVKWPERREERACEARPAGVEDGADYKKKKIKNKERKTRRGMLGSVYPTKFAQSSES